MGLNKKTLIFVLMIGLPLLAEENIASLVSTLAEPKMESPVVEQTEQEESEASAVDAGEKPEENITTIDDVASNSEEPDEETVPPVIAKVITPVFVTPVQPEPKVIEPVKPVEPVVAKIMPIVPVSPVQPEVATATHSTVAPKMINAPKLTVSKSVISPIQIVDVSDEDIEKGLDTLNIDSSGNWLEKRIWYQKAEQLFEVIRANLQKAADLRMKFVHEVNHVGHKIDEFYESVNFEKGEIDEMLAVVLQNLAQEQEIRGGDLSSSERSVKSKVQVEQKHFEVLSKDLKLIDDLDDQIDKTMMKAFKEIDTCRGLETRAWNNFKEIGLELDDKKARVLYYEMENFHKNIEQKMNYLQSNLLPYLQHQLVSKVNETMAQIKSAIQIFDSKGLNLTNILKKDEHGDLLILKERDEMQVQQVLQAKEIAAAEAKALLAPWYEKVWSSFILLMQQIFCKLQEWFGVAICFVQSVFCNISQWICRLLGY
ncbi:hypothetical protein KBB68_00630 [Candidatus Babeliales bacterium]|nr:hypothetical protein [Candidatus Babeliales bacterium]